MSTHPFAQLLEIVGPNPAALGSSDLQPLSRARRLWLAAVSYLAALSLAAAWGLAAGSHGGRLALDNLVKVPVLLVVSALAALPAALIAFRLTSSNARPSHVVLAFACASFAGTLVMAVLAPMIALYQQSSAWAGPRMALASAILGVVVAVMVFVRVLGKLLRPSGGMRGAAACSLLLFTLHAAALLQLASVVSPVFPARTTFGAGADAWRASRGGQGGAADGRGAEGNGTASEGR